MPAELYIKFLLLLYDFNQNWNLLMYGGEAYQH